MHLYRRTFLKSSLALGISSPFWGKHTDAIAEEMTGQWSPSSEPGLIATGFFHETVATGPVTVWESQGIVPLRAQQASLSLAPSKISDVEGVVFPAHKNCHMTFPFVRDSLQLYRWCLFIVNIMEAPDENQSYRLIAVNHGGGNGKNTPAVFYRRTDRHTRQFEVMWGGQSAVLRANTDDQPWQCLLTYRRNGRLFVSLNGNAAQVSASNELVAWPELNPGSESYLGHKQGQPISWALNCLLLGQTELSEALVAKLEAWAMIRVHQQSALPPSHAFRHQSPLTALSEVPQLYYFDRIAWTAWGSVATQKQSNKFMGLPALRPGLDYERVYFDDFRQSRVASSAATVDSQHLWFAPGWNLAVGASAQLRTPEQEAALYHWISPEAVTDKTVSAGIQTLALKYTNKWVGSAMYSVNNDGQGFSWQGETVFRIRFKADSYDKVPGGLFPAFWSYALEPLFHRQQERIEIDFFEFDGQSPTWINGASSHVHSAAYPGIGEHLSKDATSYKVWAGRVFEQMPHNTAIPSLWDGKWHTYEVRIEKDVTYFNITTQDEGLNGFQGWTELFRCPTPKEFLTRKYLIVNYALKVALGEPARSQNHSLYIDYIEVLQKAARLKQPPEPFTALPLLEGHTIAGATLTCRIETSKPIQAIEYRWFIDGYPCQRGNLSSLQLISEHVGKAVRCQVRLVGATHQPEAWSAPSPKILAAD